MTHTIAEAAQRFRLSFAQERIWFVEQLEAGRSPFTLGTVLHAAGDLDPASLRAALAALVDRHESLRTRFVQGPDGPAQEVLDEVRVPLEVADLIGRPDAEAAARQLAEEHLRADFDLAAPPLLRARLVRLAPDRSILLLTVHHIICDGTSAEILWRDLTELYRAATRRGAPNLPELPVQYADFAEWQRDTVDERLLAQQLEFWRRELDGATGAIDLPTDHPRPAAQDHLGATAGRTLPADLAAALVRQARREQVSPFMLLLAAFELVLARSAGASDFTVGTSIGGRTRQEVADVLGCFINLLPIRSDVTGDPTLRELLARVRRRCLSAYANSDLPFERMVEQLAPHRNLSRAPLFDVIIAVQDGRTATVHLDELTLTPELIAGDAAQYDLALNVEIDETGADVRLNYATALFTPATAELLLDRYRDALTAIAADLNRSLSAVALAGAAAGPAAEHRPEWTEGGPADPVRHALLGDDPATADLIRVRQDNRSWSGSDLWAAIQDAAGSNTGVARGPRVIDDAHPVDRIVRTAGAWLAGGCAAPVDPDAPAPWRARGRSAVADASLDADTALLTPVETAAGPSVRPLTVAAVSNSLHALAAAWEIGPDDVVLLTGSVSPVEALAVLAGGARVVFAVDEVARDGEALGAVLGAAGATAARLPADAWPRLLSAGWRPPAGFRALHAGAAPATATVEALLGAGVRLLAVLTPSDGGAWYATGEPVEAGVPTRWRPLPNTSVAVRDPTGAIALPGALGEIVLRGVHGELQTGDRGRAFVDRAPVGTGRVDGTPVLAGRTVPVRAIEAVVAGVPGVMAAAIAVAGSELVAFYAPTAVDSSAVETAVAGTLPAHLRPARAVAVDALPAGPEGAVDRAALAVRAAGVVAEAHGGPLTGPRNHLERALLDGFAHSLGRPDLGIHDDFFAAGGTSLAAARLVRELVDLVGEAVPLRLLFQHPTVAELAAAMAHEYDGSGRRTALQEAADDVTLPADIVPSGSARTGPFRCAFVTGATGFVGSHLLAQLLADGVERVVCLVRGPDDEACTTRFRERMAHYELSIDPERVEVVRGDLIEPRLGLPVDRFDVLADEMDVIYHSGAHMNFVRPYRVLSPPNVLGTREMLRLACTGRPSAMHYISTIDSRVGTVVYEAPIPIEIGKDDGYVLSKKTAENLVLQAGARGLTVGVYRPWQITSHSRTGAVNPQDQLALCLAGILATRVAPAAVPLPLRVLPVDDVARAVVALSRRPDPDRPIFHFYNRRVTPIEIVNEVVEQLGYPLRRVPFKQWRVEVVRRSANQVDGLGALLANDVSQAPLPDHVETANTERRLGPPDWPEHDVEWVRRTVRFLADRGAIQPPPRADGGSG